MVVSTRDPEVVAARAGVFEFLLVNHPLDCPGVRQGRRVSAAGFLVHVRPGRKPDGLSAPRVRRRRREGRRRLRSDADAEPQPLHPLHALRAVHARDRRRRADQHRRPRLRQRDRDVPGGGRALADLRQPDGRLPGRRDHDARLPLQEPSVGQPERRRHDLHAVLEGLQHQRVAEGEARMGEGLAADPHDAAFQSRRQQLLDVRHRPLRLPLGRGRDAPAQADACGRAPRSKPAAWHDVEPRLRDALQAAGSADRGIGPIPGVGARVAPRNCSCSSSWSKAAWRRRAEVGLVAWTRTRKAAAGRHEVQGAADRRAQRERRAGPRATRVGARQRWRCRI